jgi:hypothetical protein
MIALACRWFSVCPNLNNHDGLDSILMTQLLDESG